MIAAPRSLSYKIRKSRAAAPCQNPHSTMRTFASFPRRRVNRFSRRSILPVSPTNFLVNRSLFFSLSLLSPQGCAPATAFQKSPSYRPNVRRPLNAFPRFLVILAASLF